MQTSATLISTNTDPSNRRSIGAKKIDSVSDLESSGINYELTKSKELIILQENSQTIAIGADGTVFTSDTQDPVFARCVATTKSVFPASKVVLCTSHIINHIKTLDEENNKKNDSKFFDGGDSPSQKLFKEIIVSAISEGSSDIKILIRSGMRSRIYFKVNGTYNLIQKYTGLDKAQYLAMMRSTVDYVVHKNGGDAKENFTELKPMDLQIPFYVDGYSCVKLRMGTIPAEHGTIGVAIRIPQLDRNSKIKSLEELGFSEEHVALISDAMKAPYGLILFTGPTNSGKTTAIAAAMSLIPDNVMAITLDDPVEISLESKPSILQCPINDSDADLGWLSMLKQGLRQDPEIFSIGEIREAKVAKTMALATGTGHLILSTLHVNNAIDIPRQLSKFDLPLHEVAETTFLRLLVATRLTRGVCKYCSFPLATLASLDRNIVRLKSYFKDSLDHVRVRNPEGCMECKRTGTSSRHLIAEVVHVDGYGRELFEQRKFEEWREHLLNEGWYDMKHHAETKVRQGLICPFEAEGHLISPFGIPYGGKSKFNYKAFRESLVAQKSSSV